LILPETETIIKARLASIAEEYQIKIIYACESGSRAWGFPSPNSDYDVRFIYIHPDLSICRNTMDQSFDGETIPRIAMLDDFLVRELTRLQDAAKILPAGFGDRACLDHLFQQCLGL